jgi:hypothetical protein
MDEVEIWGSGDSVERAIEAVRAAPCNKLAVNA